MFENRVLRKIFGPGKDEVTGEWIILRSGESGDLQHSRNVIRLRKSK
jgi:hypothetical protein